MDKLTITCPNAKGGEFVELLAINCAASALASGVKEVTIKSEAKMKRSAKGVKNEVAKDLGKGVSHDTLIYSNAKELKLYDAKKADLELSKYNGLKGIVQSSPLYKDLINRIIAKSYQKTGIGYELSYILKHA